jgi:hypothetical protein
MRTMKTEHKAIGLLEKALEALHKATGIEYTIEGRDVRFDNNRIADALAHLVKNELDQIFVIEVKHRLTTATVGMAIAQLKRFTQKGMIVTDYVNPNMADRLRDKDIQFIDIAGNAYINEPPVYVYIKGNRPIEELAKEKTMRAFQPAGLKVLFALLCDPELVEAPYREIAKKAGVALGTLGWLYTDLINRGWLVDLGKRGRRLVNKGQLLERWVEAYPQKLRPNLLLGRYRGDQKHWREFAPIDHYKAYWGGEIAAAILTDYLKPQLTTIYMREKPERFLVENKLKNDPHGNVEILEVFWKFEDNWEQKHLVPPLLIYADLIATGDDRNLETAKIVYEREIARYIGED